jgi:hypothetical protein
MARAPQNRPEIGHSGSTPDRRDARLPGSGALSPRGNNGFFSSDSDRYSDGKGWPNVGGLAAVFIET